jgi:hypothetical protein
MKKYRIHQERNTLHTIKRRKPAGISKFVRRNFLLNYVIDRKLNGKIELMETRKET